MSDELRVVEEFWDDIGKSGKRFPLPLWHREEAERRAEELDANPSIALTREQLWQRVGMTNG